MNDVHKKSTSTYQRNGWPQYFLSLSLFKILYIYFANRNVEKYAGRHFLPTIISPPLISDCTKTLKTICTFPQKRAKAQTALSTLLRWCSLSKNSLSHNCGPPSTKGCVRYVPGTTYSLDLTMHGFGHLVAHQYLKHLQLVEKKLFRKSHIFDNPLWTEPQ